jgi:hypothetical protein
VAEHPLQRQIADALRLEIAPPGRVSHDGVVWRSVDHASYAGAAPGARIGRGIVAGVPDLFVLHFMRLFTQYTAILVGRSRFQQDANRTGRLLSSKDT